MVPGLAKGQKLLHFEVQEQVASGGTAIVWRGYDRLLGRHVAIKQVASPQTIDEVYRERFRREAELHKRVSQNHPNLVQVREFVDDPRGLFIIMELVEGITLEQLMAQLNGPIDPIKGLAIVRDVATGLAAIHAAGILHRDLKPANILVPDAGAIRICDFGVAALMAEQEAMDQGTPQYMAPELLSGQTADARADLYSLGMVAYELMSGRPGFERVFGAVLRDQRHQAMRWMKWHTNARTQAPPLHEVQPGVPPALSDLVARLMAKEPSQRLASAAELIEAIKRNFTKAGLAAQQQLSPAAARFGVKPGGPAGAVGSLGPATAPLPRRKRWPIVLAVLVAIQACGLVGYFLYEQSRRRQDQAAVQAANEREFAQAMQAFDRQDYPAARQAFDALVARWADHPKYGVVSSGYGLMAQYQMAVVEAERLMGEAQFERAVAIYEQMAKLVNQALALPTPPEAAKLHALIAQADRDVGKRKALLGELDAVAQAVRKSDFEGARRRLNMVRRTSTDNTALDKRVVEELGAFIEGQNANANIDQADASAANLQAQRRLADARSELDKALKKFPSSAKLKDRLSQVVQEIDFEQAMSEAQAAENNGRLADAVTGYQKAGQIRPDPVLTETINRLRGQIALNEGMELERKGDSQAAAARFQQALSLWPSPAAEARLREMKLAGDRSAVVAAADTAFAGGDFEQAAALYDKAQKLAPDPQTQTRLVESKVRRLAQQAAEAVARGQLDPAVQLVKQAMALNAQDAQVKQLASQIDNMSSFLAIMKEAAAKRQTSDFGAAKRLYQNAIDLAKAAGIDAAEAGRLKIDTEYDHLIAQARSAIEFSQWTMAKSLLLTAQKMRSTDQVQQLLKEVEDHVPKTP
jgi:tRNA A-37 threonylcarbamoyl transferase component Bud32/tetratricopeptide (TPR) repeat protein